MKPLLIMLLVWSSHLLAAQQTHIVLDSIHSNVLHESRTFRVYLPKEIIDKKQKQAQYPVLYVLDGDDNYLAISGMMHYLTEVNGNRIFPKMIVVFINNTNRTRDLTPYRVNASAMLPKAMADVTGGAEAFTQVIEKEIIPHINAKYPTSPYRALIGHSFGGIFALSVLQKHPDLFDDYIVIDPSLWYDNGRFSNTVLQTIQAGKRRNKSLFIGLANTTNEPNLNKVLVSKAAFSVHEKSILRFCQKLSHSKSMPFSYQYYPYDDHGSVPFVGAYDGLRNIFRAHQLSYYEVVNPNFDPEKRINSYYKNLSAKLKTPLEISPSELEYFDMFYSINQDKRGQQKLRAYYKKLYPLKYEKYISK
ncbi:alpha/beta hydrolase-fold protein [Aquirufa sp. LEPPI-3A]|uniref:alpha/beta hydrolase n=1 Tax=Aquirufa regiilacus TaxID=3024868 RepID=UPI0028E09866|nr:alpha/beta hydrolase-fold protein [Aquirufa sp. LEPPI-3A]MDT8887899.1 alpha/beta hydrolase-fold protein [Aquirufa sp. LEPPI-3A]